MSKARNLAILDPSVLWRLHHSSTDEVVPIAWSETLAGELQNVGQSYGLYIYEGDNHNISTNFTAAMQRTMAFFNVFVSGSNASNYF
ncbi:MAG: hypothetical protein HS103_17720 [Anaerolineales bacterium]|nr:hypothetical protein [Anaerolineales bacterium]